MPQLAPSGGPWVAFRLASLVTLESRFGWSQHGVELVFSCPTYHLRLPADSTVEIAHLRVRHSESFHLDQDGDIDIITNEFSDPPQILISNLAQTRTVNSIEVRLVGKKTNRDGLGATVKVFARGRVFTKFHDGKSGYLSQSASQPIYFGLGETNKIDRIEVLWPSGTKQTVTSGIAVGSRATITEN